MSRTRIEPATEKMMREYYKDGPLPTMRAYFLVVDEDIVGVVGFIRIGKNKFCMVSDSKAELRDKHKLAVMKFSKQMFKIADDNGWYLIAMADDEIERSPNFLEHFGFELTLDGKYERWPG